MNDFNTLVAVMNKIKPGALTVRNFIVDYNLPNRTAMHGPIQGLNMGYSDSEIVALLKQNTKEQYDGTVSAIVEIIGDYTINELSEILENPGRRTTVKLKPLYYDHEEAERGR